MQISASACSASTCGTCSCKLNIVDKVNRLSCTYWCFLLSMYGLCSLRDENNMRTPQYTYATEYYRQSSNLCDLVSSKWIIIFLFQCCFLAAFPHSLCSGLTLLHPVNSSCPALDFLIVTIWVVTPHKKLPSIDEVLLRCQVLQLVPDPAH